jgi:hypothetical protein
MRILDICELTKQFQKNGSDVFHKDNELDQLTINAINKTKSDITERSEQVEQVRKWIVSYKVHRIKGAKAIDLASTVIDFAHSEKRVAAPLSVDQIKVQFIALEKKLKSKLPSRDLNANERKVESLTSKTLWLCYPHDVPILDSNAERALRILARLQAKSFPNVGTRYETFVDAWFYFYSQIESVITVDPVDSYPYKVRVFDRLLWWLGQPSFPTADEYHKFGIGSPS